MPKPNWASKSVTLSFEEGSLLSLNEWDKMGLNEVPVTTDAISFLSHLEREDFYPWETGMNNDGEYVVIGSRKALFYLAEVVRCEKVPYRSLGMVRDLVNALVGVTTEGVAEVNGVPQFE